MKKILIVLTIFLWTLSVGAQESTEPQAEITFEGIEYNFGKIKEGTLATTTFNFSNTGKLPLVLSNVQPSCGCTTPEWPKEPIMPGQKATIKAAYNSYGRPGSFQKYITVKSNASNGDVSLIIKGEVQPTPVEPTSPVRNMMND